MKRTPLNHLVAFFLSLALVSSCPSWARLPAGIERALEASGIARESVGIWVEKLSGGREPATLNAAVPMSPASTIKTLTTLCALDLFGPAHTWKTEVTAEGWPDGKGVLRGVAIRGRGDPGLMIEDILVAAQKMHGLGVRAIEGNITADRSLFAERVEDQNAFDGQGTRTYNVGPDPLLVNLKAATLEFVPAGRYALVSMVPSLDGVSMTRRVPLSDGPCGDWKTKLGHDFSNPRSLRFSGSYPKSCGRQQWHVALWGSDAYLTALLRRAFASAGIQWSGRVREGAAPEGGRVSVIALGGMPLSTVIRRINKFSNNTMARELFLNIGLADESGETRPASLERSRAVMRSWLKAAGSYPSEVYVDNGSGLSRTTRVTPRAMAKVLEYGYRSGYMPEFVSSLPVAGVDGTMKKRPVKQGTAHIKTGLINNVQASAGYVLDTDGNWWSVTCMVNGRSVARARSFMDEVIAWCAAGGM